MHGSTKGKENAKKNGGASTTLTLRMREDFKAELLEAARRDDRSVSSYVVHAVRAQMDRDQRERRETIR